MRVPSVKFGFSFWFFCRSFFLWPSLPDRPLQFLLCGSYSTTVLVHYILENSTRRQITSVLICYCLWRKQYSFPVLIFLADLEFIVLLHNYGQLDSLLETVCFFGFEVLETLQVMEA